MNHAEEVMDDEIGLLELLEVVDSQTKDASVSSSPTTNSRVEGDIVVVEQCLKDDTPNGVDDGDDDADDDDNASTDKTKIRTTPSIQYCEHVTQILTLTVPIILSEIFQNTLPLVDVAFVGNLPGTDALAAAALASVWFNLWNTTVLGFMTATDTVLAQSFGAKEYRTFGMWTGTSLFVVSVGVVPIVAGLLALCEPAMMLFGQERHLAEMAGDFSYRLIPGLWPYYGFKVLTKYLQTQNRILPGVLIGIAANGLNVLINWLFIYRLGMGLNGAPWATSLTRLIEFVVIALYIFSLKHTQLKDTYPSFSLSRSGQLRKQILLPFLVLAVSGALSFACQAWSFEVTTIFAGLLSTVSLDAHVITLGIATFVFLSFPFAVGIATSIRVGQLIGEGAVGDARRSTDVSYGINLVLQIVLTAVLYPLSSILGDVFSADAEVSALVGRLIPISCIFMLGDAFQANTGGALRGLGRQRLVLGLNVLGFWVLAVPVDVWRRVLSRVGVWFWIGKV